ncbi:MAG: nucleotide exchange factor GrpE [Lachnospiraceae bacterium]|nr:nucleotide exchange factor GrpE [Lachnospiraceae bacterium]MBQ1640178.1 nucleotide exchange factor GrpE [Lachnospiraceae bacterium]MBR0430240.1 nucleotide exchange factor GrpE [Lachnospiraceae bacterium]
MAEEKENFSVEQEEAANTEEVTEETTTEEAPAKEEATEAAAEEAGKQDAKDKKHHKKEKKDKRDEQIADLTDRVKRQLAEFENFRTRSEKEKSQMFDMGAKTIIEKILPVVDNFERGLANAPEGDAFADGMKMIYKQMLTSLEEAGVKAIEAEGTEFNPDFHNAVMHIDDEQYGENIVVEEFQKGYTYHDQVVRHSMVKVAN